MRVENDRQAGNGGYLYHFDNPLAIPQQQYLSKLRQPREEPAPTANPYDYWKRCNDETSKPTIMEHANELGTTGLSLHWIGCVFDKETNAFVYPMFNADLKWVGLRFRHRSGKKWTLKGTHSGLFVPGKRFIEWTKELERLYIVEGATDVAAMLTIGCIAIGRPSCRGQEDTVTGLLDKHCKAVREVVIVADNDTEDSQYAGQRGAESLSHKMNRKHVVFVVPTPHKDMRDFIKAGGTKEHIESAINNLTWKAAS